MTRRILIVEDESLIAMLLEDLLADIGYTVVAAVPNVDQALTMLATEAVDLAIVDVNLGGTPSFPVADALAKRGIPFLFTTGYGQRGLPEHFAARPVLQKPFRRVDLEAALAPLAADLPKD